MNILHISAECFPIAKVGGLADVVGALPNYQKELGTQSNVVIPFYNNRFNQEHTFTEIYSNSLQLGSSSYDFRIVKLIHNELGFEVFSVDIPKLLYKEYVYSNDDTERFLAFQIATLDWLLSLTRKA